MPEVIRPNVAPNVSESYDWDGIPLLEPRIFLPTKSYVAHNNMAIVTVKGACPNTPIDWEINWASWMAEDDPPEIDRMRFHFLWKWRTPEVDFPRTMPPVGWDENFFWVGSHPPPSAMEQSMFDTGVLEVCALQNGSIIQKTVIVLLEYPDAADRVYEEIERISVFPTFMDYYLTETM